MLKVTLPLLSTFKMLSSLDLKVTFLLFKSAEWMMLDRSRFVPVSSYTGSPAYRMMETDSYTPELFPAYVQGGSREYINYSDEKETACLRGVPPKWST